jgi:transposase InsO family protein
MPEYIRSDSGPEFIAHTLADWLGERNVSTHYIEPGNPWQNAYGESFNVTLCGSVFIPWNRIQLSKLGGVPPPPNGSTDQDRGAAAMIQTWGAGQDHSFPSLITVDKEATLSP